MDRPPRHQLAPILIVCAVAQELSGLRARDRVDVIAAGVGPVEAAHGTTRALAARSYGAVINAGIAGGFRDRCGVGDVVAVTREDFADLGLEDGSAFPLPGGAVLARTVHAHPDLVRPFLDGHIAAIVGRGVTSATVTTTDARAQALAHRFRADVESMEGFAVLRAAEQAGVAAIGIRGISNRVGERAGNGWDFAAGARAAVETVDALLDVLLSE